MVERERSKERERERGEEEEREKRGRVCSFCSAKQEGEKKVILYGPLLCSSSSFQPAVCTYMYGYKVTA